MAPISGRYARVRAASLMVRGPNVQAVNPFVPNLETMRAAVDVLGAQLLQEAFEPEFTVLAQNT